MDGVPVKAEVVTLDKGSLEFGNVKIEEPEPTLSDVAAMKTMGLGNDAMILGMDIMGKFNYLGLDLESKTFMLN